LLALETSNRCARVHPPSSSFPGQRLESDTGPSCPSGEIPDPNFRLVELGVIYVIEATSSTYSVTFWFSDFSRFAFVVCLARPDPQERWLARPSEGHDEDHDGPGRAAGRPPGRQDPCSSRHGSSSSRKVSSQLGSPCLLDTNGWVRPGSAPRERKGYQSEPHGHGINTWLRIRPRNCLVSPPLHA
jgi:hypothetical protein